MNPKIQVKELYAGYNGSCILSGISLELNSADFVGVIGPNGSGKTTLLRAMSRALHPSGGTITLDGRDIYSIPARDFARRVAVVPQDTFIAFDFSVLEKLSPRRRFRDLCHTGCWFRRRLYLSPE